MRPKIPKNKDKKRKKLLEENTRKKLRQESKSRNPSQ
jgi:hypothetical protein